MMFISKKKLKNYIYMIKEENRAEKLGANYDDPISPEQAITNSIALGYESGTDNMYNAICGKFGLNRIQKKPMAEKRSKEYPAKTRMAKFLKKYPNARIKEEDGLPRVCPCDLETSYGNKCLTSCSECRKKYWLQEVK